MLEQFLKWPKLIWSSLYEKIAEAAKKTNTSVKDYLGNESNIDYISKVVYEGIPFFFKFSLKPDAFDAKFKKHFTAFRDKMYSYDDEVNAKKDSTQEMPLPQSWSEVKESFDEIDSQIKQKEYGIRVKLLQEWKEAQRILQERAKAIHDPKQLANMPAFTSDMSTEEIRNKFFAMVNEAREKRINDAEEAHAILMERAQSIPEDISAWTRVSADMSREETISKLLGVSLEEAKRLDKEYDAVELKKANKTKKPKTATVKVAPKTIRKKKVEE
jgi:hypothetical protein